MFENFQYCLNFITFLQSHRRTTFILSITFHRFSIVHTSYVHFESPTPYRINTFYRDDTSIKFEISHNLSSVCLFGGTEAVSSPSKPHRDFCRPSSNAKKKTKFRRHPEMIDDASSTILYLTTLPATTE